MDQGHDWRSELPFLPGPSVFAERIANRGHDIARDPFVAAILQQDDSAIPSWAELRNAGISALKHVGEEIARAISQAEAASATLRRATYMEGIDMLEETLLEIGARHLTKDPSFSLVTGEGFIAYGRRSVGGGLEIIPHFHWEAGEIAWKKRTLSVHGGMVWMGVQILDLADLDQYELDAVSGDFGRARNPIQSSAGESPMQQKVTPRRPAGRSLERADDALIEEIHRLFSTGEAQSPTGAAWSIIGRDGAGARGTGAPESKVSRLVKRYKARYGA